MMTPIETHNGASNQEMTMQHTNVGDPPSSAFVAAPQYGVGGTEFASGSSQIQNEEQFLQLQPQIQSSTYDENQMKLSQANGSGYEQPPQLFTTQPVQPGFVHVQQPMAGPNAGQAIGYLGVSGTASLQGPTAERDTTAPAEWMPKPVTTSTYCPPGLEYLHMIDHLVFHQQPTITNIETLGRLVFRFSIQNSLGQQVYFAEVLPGPPESAGISREITLSLTDSFGQVAIKIDHRIPDYGAIYCCGCCSGCGVTMLVEAPSGQLAGSIKQQPSCSVPMYSIVDAQGSAQLRIEGPDTCCATSTDVFLQDFGIFSDDLKHVLGKITKRRPAVPQSLLIPVQVSLDLFFPIDLDVKMKATLIGAAFTLYIYHMGVTSGQRSRRHHHHRTHHHRHGRRH